MFFTQFPIFVQNDFQKENTIAVNQNFAEKFPKDCPMIFNDEVVGYGQNFTFDGINQIMGDIFIMDEKYPTDGTVFFIDGLLCKEDGTPVSMILKTSPAE